MSPETERSCSARDEPSPAGVPPSAAYGEEWNGAAELERLRAENRQLRQAIDSRPVIDQARGILMATEACTAEQGWEILLRASQRANIKLRTIADAVVASANGPLPAGPPRRALREALARHRSFRLAESRP